MVRRARPVPLPVRPRSGELNAAEVGLGEVPIVFVPRVEAGGEVGDGLAGDLGQRREPPHAFGRVVERTVAERAVAQECCVVFAAGGDREAKCQGGVLLEGGEQAVLRSRVSPSSKWTFRAATVGDGRDTGLTSDHREGRYHHGDLRQALIDAGAALMEEGGTDGLSLRGVARAAGVSQAAPYNHFANKDALLAAIAADARLTADLDAVRTAFADPLERLGAMGRLYVMLSRLMDFVRETVREVLEARGGAGDVEVISVGAWSIVPGLAQLLNDGRVVAGQGPVPESRG